MARRFKISDGTPKYPEAVAVRSFRWKRRTKKTRHKRRNASTMLANRASRESKHGGRLDHLMSLASKH